MTKSIIMMEFSWVLSSRTEAKIWCLLCLDYSFSQDSHRATAFWTPGTSISDLQHLSQASCSPFGVIENNSALIKTPSAASHLLRLSSTKQCNKCLGKWCILPDSGQHNITLRSRKRSDDPEVSSTSCPLMRVSASMFATSTLYHWVWDAGIFSLDTSSRYCCTFSWV